jgi:hypothetical protein
MHIKIVLPEPYVGMTSGAPTRYIGMINELYKRAHLSIFAPGNTGLLKQLFPNAIICGSTSSEPSVNKFSISVFLLSFLYPVRENVFLPMFDFFPEFDAILKDDAVRNNYDAVYYFGMSTAVYFSKYDRNVLKIADFCDSLLRHFKTNYKHAVTIKKKSMVLADIVYLYRVKKKFIKKDISIIITTEKDAACIKKIIPDNPIYSIPNGISIPYTIDGDYLEKKWNSKEILFCGSLNYEPNVRSIEYILNNLWKEIRNRLPGVHLSIVGRDPSQRVIDVVAKHDGVTIYKNVPDVFEYYKTAKLILAPLFSGGGIKNKILESLTTATPVVTNREGAIGVDIKTEIHGLVKESPEELISATIKILTLEKQNYFEMAKKCSKLSEQYNWHHIGNLLYEVITKGEGKSHA